MDSLTGESLQELSGAGLHGGCSSLCEALGEGEDAASERWVLDGEIGKGLQSEGAGEGTLVGQALEEPVCGGSVLCRGQGKTTEDLDQVPAGAEILGSEGLLENLGAPGLEECGVPSGEKPELAGSFRGSGRFRAGEVPNQIFELGFLLGRHVNGSVAGARHRSSEPSSSTFGLMAIPTLEVPGLFLIVAVVLFAGVISLSLTFRAFLDSHRLKS